MPDFPWREAQFDKARLVGAHYHTMDDLKDLATELGPEGAYAMAVRIEQHGIDFYRTLSEQAETAWARNDLLGLAKEESNHRDVFRSLLDAEGFSEPPELQADTLTRVKGKLFPDVETPLKDGRAALKAGLSLEEGSIRFYEGLVTRSIDDEARAAVERILEQERAHEKRIRFLLNY